MAKNAKTLDRLIELLGPKPYQTFEGRKPREVERDQASETITAVGEAREAKAVPTLMDVMANHPDFRLRHAAADALLFFPDSKILKALVATLDFSHWSGGPFTSIAVSAAFKLNPKKAFDVVKPAFEKTTKTPTMANMIVLNALQELLFDFVPPGTLLREARAARKLPTKLFAADPKRWADACYALRFQRYTLNQQIPTTLLRLTGDPRTLDAYFDGLKYNDVATVCRALRVLDDPAAVPRLRELAGSSKDPERAFILETAMFLERLKKRNKK